MGMEEKVPVKKMEVESVANMKCACFSSLSKPNKNVNSL